MVRIFVSYSRKDVGWVTGEHGLIPWLEEQLGHDSVKIWCDPALQQQPGVDYTARITEEIEACHVAILLVSQDFVSSKFIRTIELPLIRKRFEAKQIQVIPILVDFVKWDWNDESQWIAKHQVIPNATQPLAAVEKRGGSLKQAQIEVATAVREVVRKADGPGLLQAIAAPADSVAAIAELTKAVRAIDSRLTAIEGLLRHGEKRAPASSIAKAKKASGAPRDMAPKGYTVDRMQELREELEVPAEELLLAGEVPRTMQRPPGIAFSRGEEVLAVISDLKEELVYLTTRRAFRIFNNRCQWDMPIEDFLRSEYTIDGDAIGLSGGEMIYTSGRESASLLVLFLERLHPDED